MCLSQSFALDVRLSEMDLDNIFVIVFLCKKKKKFSIFLVI